MNETVEERLYHLLPTLYHQRDLENGQALRALMAVLENELQVIEADTAATYNNWFIQTCDLWVIPYIADLVGARDMSQVKYLFSTQRRQVANTIAYRRRKGTLAVLEHVLRDATGWLVRAVESSQTVASSQHVGFMRPGLSLTVDVRQPAALAYLAGPSSQVPRTVDIHSVTAGQADMGLSGTNQVRLFFWRLRSYLMRNSPAHATGKTEPVRHHFYTFDPLGRDIPLFNYTQFISGIDQRAADIHMPLRLTREALAVDLQHYEEKYHERPEHERPPNSAYYGPERGLNVSVPVVENNTPTFKNIPPGAVMSMDLSEWPGEAVLRHWAQHKDVAIDVRLGRLALLKPLAHPGEIKVNYCYGLSDEIGGGPYRRSIELTDAEKQSSFQCDVAKGTVTNTLKQALDEWEKYYRDEYNAGRPNPSGVIRILDNGVYGNNVVVRLPPGAQLAIIADNGVRPTIGWIGYVTVIPVHAPTTQSSHGVKDTARGKAVKPIGSSTGRQLLLHGLLVSSGVHISAAKQSLIKDKLTVSIGHCTLMQNGLKATLEEVADAQGLEIDIDHSMVGPLYLPAAVARLSVTDSIIDHAGRGAGYAIAGNNQGAIGPAVDLQRVTVFGQVHAAQVTACDVIFTRRVIAPNPPLPDRQVQFSYVPAESITPAGESYRPVSKTLLPPVFTSTQFGDPAYARLSDDCPLDIRGGASDGSEMGVFHELHSLEAEANIPALLEEYLPFGLQASIQYMT